MSTRCGPCHAIAPTFEALAKQHPTVNFVKCDVDAAKEVSSAYRVSAMWVQQLYSVYASLSDLFLGTLRPTFIFLRGSKQVHMIRGADKKYVSTLLDFTHVLSAGNPVYRGLQNAVEQFASSSSTGAFSGEGHTLGGTPPLASTDLVASAKSVWSNMDPPLRILLGLLAAYAFFWMM